jgi:SecD/SecF fusion protein
MAISAVLIIVGMGAFIWRGRENLGIDFTPGSAAQLSLRKGLTMNVEDVRQRVYALGYTNAQIVTAYLGANEVAKTESDQFIIRIPQQSPDETQAQREEVLNKIQQAFADYVPSRSITVRFDGASPIKANNDPYAGGQLVTITFLAPTENSLLAPSPATGGGALNAPEAPKTAETPKPTTPETGTVATNPEKSGEVLEETSLPMDVIETALKKTGLAKAELVRQENRKYLSQVQFKTTESATDKIKAAVTAKDLIVVPNAFTYQQFVGPAQAQKMIWAAIIAVCVSMFFIVVYVGVRFGNVRYGFAAIVALVHDVLITLGAIAVATYLASSFIGRLLQLSQVDLDLNVVAAVLTVVGFSINDTIVVFDRIRENLGRRRDVTGELIDRSVNQTLSRTILTSVTVLFVCFTLYIAGGRQLHGLAFALIVGIVTGTYSSIFIANPLLIMTTRGLKVDQAQTQNGGPKRD